MIITSVAQAISELPELRLPVILIAALGNEMLGVQKVATGDHFKEIASIILMQSPDMFLIVTSDVGNDPRKSHTNA
jgi:hypothetical protein